MRLRAAARVLAVCWRADAPQLTAPRRATALIHLMKSRAVKHCHDEQKAYADCVRGRGVSLVRGNASRPLGGLP